MRFFLTVAFSAIVFLALHAGQRVLAQEQTADAVYARYADENWDPQLLRFIETGPAYLARDEDFGIQPPPENDSLQTKAETVQLQSYAQNARSEDVVELIIRDNYTPPDEVMWSHWPENKVEDAALIRAVNNALAEVNFFVLREKFKYKRARPTQLQPDLETVIDVPHHASYPSGHAAQSFMVAQVLSAIDPEGKERYEILAKRIGLRREIAGVHYPSDTEAGIALAKQVFTALLKDPEYAEIIDLAKTNFEDRQQKRKRGKNGESSEDN